MKRRGLAPIAMKRRQPPRSSPDHAAHAVDLWRVDRHQKDIRARAPGRTGLAAAMMATSCRPARPRTQLRTRWRRGAERRIARRAEIADAIRESGRSGRQSHRANMVPTIGTSLCAGPNCGGTRSPRCRQPNTNETSQNATKSARQTEAHSRMARAAAGPASQAPQAGSSSIEATPRS